MPSPINNLGPSLGTQGASGKPAQKAVDRGVSPSPVATDGPTSEVGEATRLALAADTDFDKAKVDAIKEALSAGTYVIDARKIAQNFANLERFL